MGYNINFQKAKRNFILLTFDDEREDGTPYTHTIRVGMPKKKVFHALLDMQDIKDEKDSAQTKKEKSEADRRIIDEMYRLVAKVLSNNLDGEKITTEWAEEQFSSEELKEFLEMYVKFVKGEAANPN